VLDEFYRVAFRKKIFRTIDELQADLDAWLVEYNYRRPHQGRWCFGKTPMQTFLDTLLWRRRNSWQLDHDRQTHRLDNQPTVRSNLSLRPSRQRTAAVSCVDMPGCIVSATTASFSSVEKRRRRATPVITSTFENVTDIGLFLARLRLRPTRHVAAHKSWHIRVKFGYSSRARRNGYHARVRSKRNALQT
jgi:hypothetical protein